MLKANEIRVLIVMRLLAAFGSCNNYHQNHVEGQLRALLAVLHNGEAPFIDTGLAADWLDAAKIPWGPHPEGEGWVVDDKWLRAQGCSYKKGKLYHPKLSKHSW